MLTSCYLELEVLGNGRFSRCCKISSFEVKTSPEILASINNLKMAKGSGDYPKEKLAFDEFKIALKKEHAKKELSMRRNC